MITIKDLPVGSIVRLKLEDSALYEVCDHSALGSRDQVQLRLKDGRNTQVLFHPISHVAEVVVKMRPSLRAARALLAGHAACVDQYLGAEGDGPGSVAELDLKILEQAADVIDKFTKPEVPAE